MSLQNFIYGLIIGLGFIIPGVSGGVIATILGIYDKIIDSILTIKNNFKSNLAFLLPIILGIIISVLFFSKIILYLLEEKLYFISYVFIGLILGSVPSLIKEIKIKTGKNLQISAFSVTFIIGVICLIIKIKNPLSSSTPNPIIMFLTGIFYAIGKLIPGISGASLLMLLGVYEYFLKIISNPLMINLKIIINFIPFIISFLISAYVILKLLNYLFHHYFRSTYSAIIGFVISSVFFIYPNYISVSSIIILSLSFLISYLLST